MRPEWTSEPVPYGRPGWAEQLRSCPDDYVVSGVLPSSEYEWRAARRRPEFREFLERVYDQEPYAAPVNDEYDFGSDEGCEAVFVPAGEAPTESLAIEAEKHGFEVEWGDVTQGMAKAWVYDPVVQAAFAEDYNVYTLRSELPPAPCETD